MYAELAKMMEDCTLESEIRSAMCDCKAEDLEYCPCWEISEAVLTERMIDSVDTPRYEGRGAGFRQALHPLPKRAAP